MKYILIAILITFICGCSENKTDIDSLIDNEKKKSYKQGYDDGYSTAVKKLDLKYKDEFKELEIKYEKIHTKLKEQLLAQQFNDTAKFFYQKETVFNNLFIIRFYNNRYNFIDKKFTLVTNMIDTSYFFNFPLNQNHNSRDVDNFLKKIGKFYSNQYNTKIDTSKFFLKEIMPIDSTNFIGIFIDYYGFESIYYAYCKIKLIEDYYILDNFYTNLDITGIGSFKYEKVINLNNNEFYIISHESGEGIESIALHYFPYNFHNKTYTLEKCFPSSEDEPHDEKLEYKYDYENGTIYIEKYEIERDKEKEWRILSQKKTNLIDIIKKLRESS